MRACGKTCRTASANCPRLAPMSTTVRSGPRLRSTRACSTPAATRLRNSASRQMGTVRMLVSLRALMVKCRILY